MDLEAGRKNTCRHCGGNIAWLTLDADRPYVKTWKHTGVKFKDTDARLCPVEFQKEEDLGSYRQQVAKPVNLCYERLEGDYLGYCHRPVQDPEIFMCGTHAKKWHERQEYLDKRDEKKLDDTILETLEPFCEMLNDFYLLDARPEQVPGYRHTGQIYTGYIAVNPQVLKDLLDQIQETF